MKKILVLLLLWLITLPVLAQNTILIIGDSISSGYGIDVDKGWTILLEQRLNELQYDYRIINSSFTGDTTANAMLRLPLGLKQYNPQITIIEVGGNDGLRGFQTSVIQNNLNAMIMLALRINSKVLLLGVRLPPNYGNGYRQAFNQMFAAFANRTDISVVPNVLANIDDDPKLMQADGIHPNTEAQIKILDNVWARLQPLLIVE